jgi:hypothetical protein
MHNTKHCTIYELERENRVARTVRDSSDDRGGLAALVAQVGEGAEAEVEPVPVLFHFHIALQHGKLAAPRVHVDSGGRSALVRRISNMSP